MTGSRWLLLVTGALVLAAGCAPTSAPVETPAPAPEPPQTRLLYTPPSTPPAEPAVMPGAGTPEEVLNEIRAALQDRGLTVTQFEPERGFLAATLSSRRTADYVDCGWIVETAPDGRNRLHPASSERLELHVDRAGRPAATERVLEMDARILVTAAPREPDRLELVSSADYVLIMTVRDQGGGPPEHDLAHFKTGERGGFARGTTCQSTGRLESEILELSRAVAWSD